jgi:SAM-dependent methyltransferase
MGGMEERAWSSRAIDAVDFRETQHTLWDAAAVGWKEWSEFTDSFAGHISERLVELADVQPGSRVLDIAAGYGEPALAAARKAGSEGCVVATDISAEMLAFGHQQPPLLPAPGISHARDRA